MFLVETDWLEKNLDTVKIIDCSWHMPQAYRDGYKEYKKCHIPKSIFFDLDKNSKKETDLPHMLVDLDNWEKIVSEMGIANNDQIIIYDNSDVLSACRCWYNFIYFGHRPEFVKVLNGGFRKWLNENKVTSKEIKKFNKTQYKANEIKSLVKNKEEIDQNILRKEFHVIDARSVERFRGEVNEPRKGLRSGNIENSSCIPFNELINIDKTFKSKNEIKKIFNESLKNINTENVIFSCGSGVTACVLALAYSIINDKYLPKIYDGSWAEYGRI